MVHSLSLIIIIIIFFCFARPLSAVSYYNINCLANDGHYFLSDSTHMIVPIIIKITQMSLILSINIISPSYYMKLLQNEQTSPIVYLFSEGKKKKKKKEKKKST